MKKLLLLSLSVFLFVLALGSVASAHENELAQIAEVTAQDLGVAEPTLLPTSPLYFVKEWGRGIRLFFTFNPVAKAELELRFADEKAVEAKEVAERSPENQQALERAVENYKEAGDRLKARLEALNQTSQNPNVSRLLDNLADRALKHEHLFEELGEKAAGEVKTELEENKDVIAEGLIEAADKLEDADKLVRRIKKIVDAKEVKDELENVRKIEFLNLLEEKAAREEAKEELRKAREDFVEDLKDIFEEEFKEADVEDITERLKELPGDEALRAKIISEIKLRAEAAEGAKLETVSGALTSEAAIFEDISKRAEEQIRNAGEKIAELEKKMTEKPERTTAAIKQLFAEAKNKLARAKKAFENKDYGEAFGQANATEAIARNGLRLIEKEEVDTGDLQEDIAELEAKINRYEEMMRSRGWTEKNAPEAYRLLDETRKHLSLARDALAKNDFAGTKLHIGHVKDWLRDLARLFAKEADQPTLRPAPIPCPAIRIDACEKNAASDDCVRELKALAAKYPNCGYEKRIRVAECGPQPGAPGNWVCKDGKWQLVPETSGGTPSTVRKCGVNTFSVSNECTDIFSAFRATNLFRNAYIQCYDGYEERRGAEDNASCQSSEAWQEYARKICANRCSGSNVKPMPMPIPAPGVKPTPIPTPVPTPPTISPTPLPDVVCTQEWNPVCGSNGKTYSNECMAKAAGVTVQYKGECQIATKTDCGPMPSLAAPPAGCKYDGPYCKEGQWRYSLVCPEAETPATNADTSITPSVQ